MSNYFVIKLQSYSLKKKKKEEGEEREKERALGRKWECSLQGVRL